MFETEMFKHMNIINKIKNFELEVQLINSVCSCKVFKICNQQL